MSARSLAVISFDGVHLLIPQQAVATIEMASSIVKGDTPGRTIGNLKTKAGEWPVYALTADFKSRVDCPPNYRYCVAINHENREAFSIACEEVSALTIGNDEELKPLQACMRTPGNPIESVVLKGDKLMLLSNVETMQEFLSPRVAA
ncbi:MAG: hypothetical protein GY785_03990 [Gammaproteobacteria bacterium]|nr:hypothetical protein [Gammaproteobacteria bacterium]